MLHCDLVIAIPSCAVHPNHHPAERRMHPILNLDPAIEPAGAIEAVAMFRDQTLQAHQASVPEQVRADLALLEVGEVDAVHAPR
jgi:hypothetical protein